MHRFFVPPDWIKQDSILIAGALVHQIRHVLRLQKDDPFIVVDGSGWEYEVVINRLQGRQIEAAMRGKRLCSTEPGTHITLYQGWMKGSKFEMVLQKGTEIGISAFVPLLCQRCVAQPTGEGVKARYERWRSIVREAAEQSGRGIITEIHPALPMREACYSARGLSLLPWEGERDTSLRSILRAGSGHEEINIFIGPEGGFTVEEVEMAKSCGIQSVTLGPRVLRAETAGLVATSAVLYEFGDMESVK